MTLYGVIDNLKRIANTQPNIRSCGEGDIYKFYNANPSIEYSTFFITQQQHREDDMFDHYGLTVFYVDRLDDVLNNKVQIQSAGKKCLSNVIKLFCENFDADCGEIVYQTFTERFNDECAGIFANVTFTISKDTVCGEEYNIH